MHNPQLIRHFGKIKATRANAVLMTDLAREYGSVAGMIAQWPEDNIIGLWQLFKKRGKQGRQFRCLLSAHAGQGYVHFNR